jgi:hypothetical protein
MQGDGSAFDGQKKYLSRKLDLRLDAEEDVGCKKLCRIL